VTYQHGYVTFIDEKRQTRSNIKLDNLRWLDDYSYTASMTFEGATHFFNASLTQDCKGSHGQWSNGLLSTSFTASRLDIR
jgi:hypothetical protein